MKILIAASVALALAAVPAQAAVPVPVMKVMGADFYMRCTNPPADRGAQIVGVCAAYVAGIADDLKDAGQVCLAPGGNPGPAAALCTELDQGTHAKRRLSGRHADQDRTDEGVPL